jgi:N-methylhydantoinase A/oxoprolinase/acetone carboxylase beta subunit
LLEGDVASVGVVGMGAKGIDALRGRSQTRCEEIELAPGRMLRTGHTFVTLDSEKGMSKDEAVRAIRDLTQEGAKSIVASQAFGVDSPENEDLVEQVAGELGLPSTSGHEITRLYGLKTRTRTAVINASILPKMMETASMTEESIKKAGIKAPLMIMRGDGGVMHINEMKRRPIVTLLSGPAASVAGALLYIRVSNGIFFEVGGTSTNIGVIMNGRPTMKYVTIGGHQTFLNSLDIRVLGIAGGSMIRVRGKSIVDVGPRSAHIAGLPYSAFSKSEEINDPKVVFVQPKPGDPEDYVAIRTAKGDTVAITLTCAANALGVTKPGDFAYGNPEAARRAIKPLADMLNMTIEETAIAILDKASEKVISLVNELTKEYRLDPVNIVLTGGGGGAAALIPYAARKLDINYTIAENAEVISSIGAALALVRDVVERTVVNTTDEDFLKIRKEAEEAAIRSGAAQGTVNVFVSYDPSKCKMIAVATGSLDLESREIKEATLEERKNIAAESMRVDPKDVKLVSSTETMEAFSAKVKRKGLLAKFSGEETLVRIVDRRGFIRLQLSNAVTVESTVEKAIGDLEKLIDEYKIPEEGGWTIRSPDRPTSFK